MEMEIICISSDDEVDLLKKNKKTKSNNTALTSEKIETLSSGDEKVEENNLKRKILKTDAELQTQSGMEKKKKLDTDRNTFVAIKVQPDLSHKLSNKIAHTVQPKNQEEVQSNTKKRKLSTDQDTSVATVTVQPVLNHTSDKLNHTVQPNDQEIIIEPKLVVKEKKKISYIAHDVFPLFISLCLQRSKSTDKKDMEKIVNKLKRRYEELDPEYTSSERFVSFINEKRVAIMNNNKTIYVHIHEVMNEMKRSIKKKSHALPSDETYDAVPSTSYATSNLPTDNTVKSDYNNDDEENTSPKTRHKIKQILLTMAKCEKTIKKLEEAEVDFDEEDDSTYIQVEKYKQRMVELHNKYCELTGENADAGRAYLRPKHISATRIVAVDQAITNFINSKIAGRNKMKKKKALTEDVIFPDYRDILECVTRCNDKRNLGLDRRKQEQLAFLELGEFLQRTRRNDYWDTFSLYLENDEEDPAVKDKDLAQKLKDNRTEGEKRLAAVFAKYSKKQEEIKEQNDIEKSSSSEEEEEEGEEESVLDDKNKDDVSVTSLTEVESDNEEDINEKVKDKSLVVKNDVNINTVNINSNTDKGMSNKAILDVSPQKCKTDKVKILMKENVAVKNKNQITGTKIGYKTCNNNTVAKDVIDTDAKTPEDLVPICSTTDCTSNNNKIEEDLPEVIMEDMSTVTADPVIQTVTEDAADVIPGAIAEPIVEEAEIIADDETEVIAENTKDVAVTEIQRDEEIKPLLRVRSFAKPPTTWEVDNRQKIVNTTQEKAPKAETQVKEVVDLTNETTSKPSTVTTKKTSPVTKCTIQLGNKFVPVVKSQRLTVIPSNRNIINVQNITNNYLKVNTATGQIIAPVRDICVQIPSAQATTTRQNQPQTPVIVRNAVPFRGNETILRIFQQGKPPIILAKKSVIQAQSVPKQTNVQSSKTKPK